MSATWTLVWPAKGMGVRGQDQSKYKGVRRWVTHTLFGTLPATASLLLFGF